MTNGHPVILDVRGRPVRPADAAARPVVGRRRARITRALHVPPTMTGRVGRAWECDLEAVRRKTHAPQTDAMLCHWIVEAPWSHEVIHSYSLVLIHLRFDAGRPVTRYVAGATHELHLFAIHPQAPRDVMLTSGIDASKWLQPVVFAAQVVEPSDEGALSRVRRAVTMVCDGRISPHVDHVRAWCELFGDAMMRAPGVTL